MTAVKKNKTADAEEICVFWTKILRDKDNELKDRLKVSELLAKANGVFAAEGGSGVQSGPLEGMSLEDKIELIGIISRGD